MIKSRHHRLTAWFFDLFFRIKMKFHFRGVKVIGDLPAPGKAILLIQNHFSWWDGYWSFYLSRTIFRRRFHVMMLEEQLSKRMFINRCGAFSVRKNTREVRESLLYAVQLLEDPQNLVCLYPQGRIQSQYLKTLHFEKGASWLIKNAPQNFQVCFCCCLVDYMSRPKPEVRIYLKNFHFVDPEKLETLYNRFRDECISRQFEKEENKN